MSKKLLITGHWKDTGEKFTDKEVSPVLIPDDLEFGEYFYYGLSEHDIQDEISLGEKTQLEFVITSYKIK